MDIVYGSIHGIKYSRYLVYKNYGFVFTTKMKDSTLSHNFDSELYQHL